MKKKKITGKQIKIFINMISLAIFCFSYFYLYENYTEKIEAAYTEAEQVKAQIKDREKKLSEEDEVMLKIPGVKEQKQEIIDNFPIYIAAEDNYMFVEQMEEALTIQTASVDMTESVHFRDTILPAIGTELNTDDTKDDTEAEAGAEMMTATVNTVSMNFITSYEGFKELTEYIRDYPEHTVIDNVTISIDNSTGVLAGNMTIRRYALTGTGKEYEAPSIEGIDIGTDNIFGTDDR